MTVYVDDTLEFPGKGEWCHMGADTLDELHTMANKLGLRREWFQPSRTLPHYDLRPSKRKLAVKFGAVEIDALAFLDWRKSVWTRERIDKELGLSK